MSAGDVWAGIAGQDRAVTALRRAAARPQHAYLLAGPRGSGVVEAARAFAAEIVGAGADDRVRTGRHPDVVEFEPIGTEYSVRDDVRARILPETHSSPIEGERKCVMLLDAERLNEPSENALLKILEEPPERTVIILVAESADALLPTVRSRCHRVDFGTLDDRTIAAALEAEGVEPARIPALIALSGGRLDRALGFTRELGTLREMFASVPARVDGTGAVAIVLADACVAALKTAIEAVDSRHEREMAELDAEIEQHQYPARNAQALRKRLRERQRREERRARTDALAEGITAIETVYRDALVGGLPALGAGARLRVRPAEAAAALEACARARRAFEFNPQDGLLLERLIMFLPPVDAGAG